ncbi:MAG: tetratricopeptide repeat protein [Pseudomonadales bacterium]
MDTYRTEDEQVEAIKRWWKTNGSGTLGAIAVAVALYFGWQGWQNHSLESAQAASSVYQELLDISEVMLTADGATKENFATAAHLVASLKTDYAGTSQEHYAVLINARMLAEQGDRDGAMAELRSLLAQQPELAVKLAASARLARLLIDANKLDEAMVLAQPADASSFTAVFAELRGDIYYIQGDIDKARAAYQEAVAGQSAQENPLLTIKLEGISPKGKTQTTEEAEES